MTDVPMSSFDPIFWLHHSNVERLHYCWLSRHAVPTVLKYWKPKDPKSKEPVSAEDWIPMTDIPLWPFPDRAQLSYENLPWHAGKGGKSMQPTCAAQWWDNTTLDYHYENTSDVGVKAPPVKFNSKTHAKVHVVLSNMYVRGSGLLRPIIKIGTHEVQLHPRAMFFAPSTAPCPACDQRRLTLGWDVVVPKSALVKKAVAAVAAGRKKGKSAAVTSEASGEGDAIVEVAELHLNGMVLDTAPVTAAWRHTE